MRGSYNQLDKTLVTKIDQLKEQVQPDGTISKGTDAFSTELGQQGS